MMMESSSIPTKEEEAETRKMPNWLELPRDITENILLRLGTIDIVKSACLVCPLWWNIFKDPLMWRSINMTDITSFSGHYSEFEKIFLYAVDQSCGHLEDIVIEYFTTGDILDYVALKASNLRSIRILNSWKVSDKRFIDAVRKIPQLEEVDISWSNIVYKDSLESLGRSCPLLKSLRFNRLPRMWASMPGSAADNDDDALIISETMPRLCRLEITGTKLTNIGLLAILDGCPLLEYRNIQACSNLSLSESLRKRCLEQIKEFRLPMLDFIDDIDYFEYCVKYCR